MTSEAAAELEFVAKVSHELRGPLHSILGLAELMIESGAEGENHRLATAIHREAGSLQVMIDDLLNFARISAGRFELSVEPFSPARVIADIVASAQPSATRKGLSMLVDVDPGVPRSVSGDGLRYGQVIRNLVTNALRYTDRGSVAVQVSLDGDAVVCEVTDTGIGISPDAMEQLFRPFHQGHVSRPGGTGLGLAISRRIVELMDGSITVDSQVG
ncbi:MAG: HAMP domain-containing histidine kinase, partial [Acidimicrobiia bacterium]|nr:HAMP domain-containing histidine kinase [Acidimicrobiia bacterium]